MLPQLFILSTVYSDFFRLASLAEMTCSSVCSRDHLQGVKDLTSAFRRYQSFSVEELNHDPSDLLGFFMEDTSTSDAMHSTQRRSGSPNGARGGHLLPAKVLVDGLPWEERNTIYNLDPDPPVRLDKLRSFIYFLLILALTFGLAINMGGATERKRTAALPHGRRIPSIPLSDRVLVLQHAIHAQI